jgi:ABC-2 type transport system ATP-binding protein
LLTPDSGAAVIAGHDVLREPDKVRAKIGLAGQSVTMDTYPSGLANLTMIGRYTASAAGTPDCEAKS